MILAWRRPFLEIATILCPEVNETDRVVSVESRNSAVDVGGTQTK